MALPSYRSLRNDINQIIEFSSRLGMAQRMSIFGGMQKMVQHEGDGAKFIYPDGSEDFTEYKEVVSERIITDEELMDMKLEDVLGMAQNLGNDIGDKKAKGIFQSVGEATKKTGNTVDSKGEKFSIELFFETLSKIDIDFDEEGNPQMPTMYIHPSMADRVREVMANDTNTPEHDKLYNELIAKKKEEWNARESRRKLVD